MFPSSTHKDWNYYGFQTGKCCCTTGSHVCHFLFSYFMLGVVHTQLFIRGGGRTEEVDKGSWLVDEAKRP